MKKRKGKTKRWLAGILSAVLVIGSINLVDALEGSNGESALYDAPELTITQGAETYDLKEGITYDSSLYELAVVNEGGFDVNTEGDYEVTYSLTSKDDGTLDPGDSGDASNSDNENKDQIQETMQMPDREIRVLTAAMQETVRMPDREIQVRTAAMQKILQMRSAERMQHRVRRIPATPVY